MSKPTTPPPRNRRKIAALELCHSTLRVATLTGKVDGEAEVAVHEIPWRREAVSLQTEAGVRELAEALRDAAQQFELTSRNLYVAISGDYCVTRVISGASEHVKAEVAQLEKRSALYLSLGQGSKAIGGSVQQVDARHQHALLTVLNQRVLDAVLDVSRQAGLNVVCVEPSLVSVSRFLGRAGYDADQPSLMVSYGERGVEVGVSYQGQLLLDYRPAGRESTAEATELVLRHLPRIERYCDRYVRIKSGILSRAFIVGKASEMAEARGLFETDGRLTVATGDALDRAGDWSLVGAPDAVAPAVVGALLRADPRAPQHAAPNLYNGAAVEQPRSLARNIVKTCWPLAAAVLVAAVGGLSNYVTNQKIAATQTQIAELDGAQAEARVARLTLSRDQTHLTYLEQILQNDSGLPAPQLIEGISHCVPDDVWLDSLSVVKLETISVAGASYSEEGIYELIQLLRGQPWLADVALSGTHAGRDRLGPVTRFELRLQIRRSAVPPSRSPAPTAAEVAVQTPGADQPLPR